MKKTGVIILAGGTGNRFKAEIPKQFVNLNGRPIISYTLETFSKHPAISYIIVAAHEQWTGRIKELCPKAIIVKGGATRLESSCNALKACDPDTDYILIHDAVRPFTDFKIIDDCLSALEQGNQAVDTIIPTFDTIVSVDRNNRIVDMPDRSLLFRGQTPQAFNFKTIYDIYMNPRETSGIVPTDDMRLLFNKGIKCVCVPGSEFNIKITTLADLYLAERIAQSLHNVAPVNPNLKGRKCLIFGATGGIGRATAEVFKKHGADVFPVGKKDFNLLRFDAYENFFNKVRAEFGMVDILINAAGTLEKGALIDSDFSRVEQMLDLNLKAPFAITRTAVRILMNENGRIFHIGSSSWSRGRKEYAAYSAAKAGLVNFVQSMAEELAPLGIKINCINPPRTNTKMRREAFPGEDPVTLMDPVTIANAILAYSDSAESGCIIDLKLGMKD